MLPLSGSSVHSSGARPNGPPPTRSDRCPESIAKCQAEDHGGHHMIQRRHGSSASVSAAGEPRRPLWSEGITEPVSGGAFDANAGPPEEAFAGSLPAVIKSVSITKVPPVRSAQAHVRTAHPPLPGGSGCAAPAPSRRSHTPVGNGLDDRAGSAPTDLFMASLAPQRVGNLRRQQPRRVQLVRPSEEPLCCGGVLLFDQPLGGHDQPHHQNRRSRRTTSSSRRLTLMVAILPSDVVRLIAWPCCLRRSIATATQQFRRKKRCRKPCRW